MSREALFRPPDALAYPSLLVLVGPQVGEMFRLSGSEMVIGREANCDIQLLDDAVSRRHARTAVDSAGLVLEDLHSRNGTTVNGHIIQRVPLREGDKIQLGSTTVLRFTYQDSLDEGFQRLMLESALRDGLTGAFNKRYFIDRLENELRFAQRHRSPLSLLLLDIDRFKTINDRFGHVAGDLVLSKLVRRVLEIVRVEDVVARYGGEEFAVIGRGIDPDKARILAERIRSGVEQTDFDDGGHRIPVTVSIGIAGLPDVAVQSSESLIRTADSALYMAKTAGRNRAEVARIAAPTDSSVAASPLGEHQSRVRAVTRTHSLVATPVAPDAPRLTVPPKNDGRTK